MYMFMNILIVLLQIFKKIAYYFVTYRAFTTGAPPAPRYHHSAVIHENSMFVFGKNFCSFLQPATKMCFENHYVKL